LLDLAPSIPIRKLLTFLRGTCLVPLHSPTAPDLWLIGSRFHVVAVPSELDDEPVRELTSFTKDLKLLAEWLLLIGVTTVAMESTGIYWVPVYEILVAKGIEVYLVNARHAKNVPGRKTDICDAQWLQQLHSYGLIRASLQPDQRIAALRTYFRQRDLLVRYRSSHQQHMQKALMQMNLQLHHVVKDITGLTGRRIIDAISSGERDPQKLASLRDKRCKESQDTIAAALQGNYQEDHLFELKVAVDLFDSYPAKIKECELAGQSLLTQLAGDQFVAPDKQAGDWRIRANGFSFNPKALIESISGHNLLSLPGLGPTTVITLISEQDFSWQGAFISNSPRRYSCWQRLLDGSGASQSSQYGAWRIPATIGSKDWQKQSIDCDCTKDCYSLL
jgi:transposase